MGAVTQPGARRLKTDGTWRILSGETMVLTVIARTQARSVTDLEAPLVVVVHQPELVHLERLEALQRDRAIRLVLSGETP